jgi:hypothetical protein
VEDLCLAACTHTIVASVDGRNPVEEPHHWIRRPVSLWPPRSIERNMLIIMPESSNSLRKITGHRGLRATPARDLGCVRIYISWVRFGSAEIQIDPRAEFSRWLKISFPSARWRSAANRSAQSPNPSALSTVPAQRRVRPRCCRRRGQPRGHKPRRLPRGPAPFPPPR